MNSRPRLAALLGCASLLAGPAAAQAALDFTIDSAATQFTYGGTSTLGGIVGNPPNFGLSGTTGILLDGTAGAAPTSIAFAGSGSALVAPDINASIPNPVPFFPALATVTITNLTLSFSSTSTPVDAQGNFVSQVLTQALSGTVTVTPITGSPTVNDLTGTQSLPQPFLGSVSVNGNDTRVSGPLDIDFTFTDPASGISATLNLTGTLAADYSAAAPTIHCTSNANSTGATATLQPGGSPSLSAADLVLNATALPQNQFALFILSETPDVNPGFGGSQGTLCVGGSIIRINSSLQNTGGSGAASLMVPYGMIPGATIDIGETWYFQAWFRDVSGGMATSNTTDGIQVTFAP